MKALILFFLLAAAAAQGQEDIETADGAYRAFKDTHGRYVRLESSDGVVVHYLYDSPSATAEWGVTINVANGPALTVYYDAQGALWSPGMPRLKVVGDAGGRITEVRADDKAIATFEYRADEYVRAVSIPGHFTMRVAPPDARRRVRQTLVDANGRAIQQTDVVSSADTVGIWKRMSFDTVAQALGFDPQELSFEQSPAGYLQTGRDGEGHVALYIVAAGQSSVGFTPDGVPRFYDIAANILDSDIPPGSDVGTSFALEQSKAVPAHVTLTADGMPGIYIEEPANGAIYAAWVERDRHGATMTKYARATVMSHRTR